MLLKFRRLKSTYNKLFIALIVVGIVFFSYSGNAFAFVGSSKPLPAPEDSTDNEVNLNAGEVSHKIPLTLPPGTNNLEPKLTLEYHSSNSHGNGVFFGLGWGIDVPYIYRDVHFTPGNTGDDTYKMVWNGVNYKLVDQGSGKFKTNIETFLNITHQTGANDYWTVQTTDGTTYRLGYNSDSEMACSNRSYTLGWVLDTVTDIHSNNIYYTYVQNPNTNDIGAIYPLKIEYNNDKDRVINFLTETSDSSTMREGYYEGCRIRYARNLSSITTNINSTQVKKYSLSYSNTTSRNILNSVTELGSNNTAKPATTFQYFSEPSQWASSTQSWGRSDYIMGSHTFLQDMNGDALPDIVKSESGSNGWLVTLNTGTSFSSTTANWGRSDYIWGPNTFLQDMNGDALPDIVKSESGSNGWLVTLNTGSGFSSTTANWGRSDYIWGPNTFLQDMNGDALPDIVKSESGSNGWQVTLNTGSGFSSTTANWGRSDYILSSNTFLQDMNGDSLPDIVYSSSGSNGWQVTLNTGTEFSSTTTNWGRSDYIWGSNTFLQDMNSDSLPDIVKSESGSNGWQVILNKGAGFSSTMTNWGRSDYILSSSTILRDMNGDGIPDIVYSSSGSNGWQITVSNGHAPNLLNMITTSMGGNISFDYLPSTSYTNTFLPFPMWVVHNKTVSNGLSNAHGTSDETIYTYKDGLYNTTNKEFRGFGEVHQTDPNDAKKQTFFKQDDGLKGIMYQQKITDSSGNLYAQSDYTWNSSLSSGVYTNTLTSKKDYTYDGSASNPKIIQTDYQYDSYGNITKQSEKGDTSITTDDRFIYNAYVYNTTDWIVDNVKNTYKTASDDSTKVSESWFYYDGNTGLDTAPTKGDITKEVKWLDTSGASNPVTQYTYDTYGNQTSVTDDNNQTTTTAFDTTTHTHPISKTNAKNHVTTLSYDLGTGNLLSSTDPNGFPTSYEYDVFGRVIKEIKPYDSSTYPTTSYTYSFDGVAPESTLVSKREVSSSSGTLDVYTYTDGLNRKIQTRADAEDTTKQIVTDTFYDPNGEVKKETVPYLASASTTYGTPDQNAKYTEWTYDELSRVTDVRNPKGGNKSTTYDHWKETIIDENWNIKREYKNAFGKIIKVDEVEGGLSYSTNYSYTPNDDLSGISDASSNLTSFVYDSLRRKTSQTDPDMGTWEYEYDGVGNVTEQTDNRDVTIVKTYDELNRLTLVNYPTDTDITYTYDGNSKKGTLTTVVDKAGTVNFAYDNRLRKIEEERTINGTTKTTEFSYDAADRTKSQTNPDGEEISYAFNAQGEINSATGTSAIVSDIDYNALGKITEKDFANGLTTNYTYNTNDLRLSRIQTGSLQDLNYTYDEVGNVKTTFDDVTDKTKYFGYDDLDRLTTASESGGFSNTYEYNSIGNLTKFTDSSKEIQYSYGGAAGPHAVTSKSETIIDTTNIALGKTATASAMQDNDPYFIPGKAVDGNTSTRWASGYSDTQWLTIDLGEMHAISRVKLNWENAFADGYQIQVSSNSATWSTIYSTTTGNGDIDNLTGLSGSGRYVRMQSTHRAPGFSGISLYEVEIYGHSISDTVNIALNKAATASAMQDNDPYFIPSKAVDGNTGTRWGSGYSDTQWLNVDLGAVYDISRVKLNWENAYADGYQIQVSNDASSWSTIYTTTTGNGGTDDLTELSGTGRYVRMQSTHRAPGFSGISLWEFEIYGHLSQVSDTTNLALSKTTTASAIQDNDSNYASSKAVDGNGSSRWASGYSDSQWLTVDLGQTYDISRVKLNWENAFADGYQIQVSSNSASWSTIYTTTTGNGGIDDLTGLSGSGRYVRMQATHRAPGFSGMSLWEFEVYGHLPGTGTGGNYVYDANGNMTSEGTKCYEYNEANQLAKVKQCTDGQTIAEYIYDYNGNRMVKKHYTGGTHSYSYISWSDSYESKVIVGGATDNTAYYWINGQLTAKKKPDGSKLYYQSDHLGSTSLITNQSGTLVESTQYDPWGEVLAGGTQSKFLYTGQEKDAETGLNYYNARYYNSDIRRFTQPDDIIQDAYAPQTLNRYSYVNNNPVRYTDPTGHCIQCFAVVGSGFFLLGLQTGGFADGLVNSPNPSIGGRLKNGVVGAQRAVESQPGQIALGVATMGMSLNAGSTNLTLNKGSVASSVGQKITTLQEKVKKNNILRVNTERIAVGPSLANYNELKSQNKAAIPFHFELNRKAGFIENYNKMIYDPRTKNYYPSVTVLYGKFTPYSKK